MTGGPSPALMRRRMVSLEQPQNLAASGSLRT